MRSLVRLLAASALLVVSALAGGAASAGAKTVWLCRPGMAGDPCTPGLSTTVFSPAGRVLRVEHPRPVRTGIDCFYVYPTVSTQQTTLANLTIDPIERLVALLQAARYSQECRVFAPMYRQLTLKAIFTPGLVTAATFAVPLEDVRSAFREYLRRYNHGRGFVLIGHSQGTYILRRLIAQDIDPNPALRRRLVSAIALGGNVTVRSGSDRGVDFKHIAACRSRTQTGCVIAYSTFDAPVPADAMFGRTPGPGQQVLCTNPAALAGGTGSLDPIAPTVASGLFGINLGHPRTAWVAVPGAFSARCSAAGGASVLQVTPQPGVPAPHPILTPGWGLHLLDANIALGNLVAIVRSEAAAYARRHRG